jgi:hypothetical protein
MMILLVPLIGMEFNGVSIRFGQSRAEVEAVLGEAERSHNSRRYYFGGELALDFDSADAVNFIEFLGGPGGKLSPELYGLPVFETDAEQVLELLSAHGEAVDQDGGYTVTVPELSLGLYREITPSDVEEMVRQMAKMDVTALGEFNLDAEQRRANRWETIGIGTKNYYA